MARPVRESLDYYPFDVNFFSDIKITKLKIKSGHDSILILIYLYTLIYSDKGYYTTSEDAKLLIMDYFQKDEDEVGSIINLFMTMNLIDKNMYEKYKIFTSAGIQKRYIEVAKRRKGGTIKNSYCLVNVTETPVNVTETPVNVTFSTQRKGKERKEKERKERGKDARARETSRAPLIAYGKFHNVLLTEDEYQEITETYANSKELIKKVDIYLANATREYSNHFALIIKIATEDKWAKKQVKPNGFNGADEQKKIKAAPMPEKLREKLKDFKLKGIEEVE